jgi:hypothetical protein
MSYNIMLAILFLFIELTHAKFIKSTVYLNENHPAIYLTKFAIDVGTASYDMKLKMSKGPKEYNDTKYPLKLALIKDDRWDPDMLNCNLNNANKIEKVELPADGSWVRDVKGLIQEQEDPHFWYFILADCDKTLSKETKLRLEISILNEDGSHLSAEQKGLLRIYYILVFVYFLGLGANLYKLYRVFQVNESIEGNMLTLNFAVLFQVVSIVFYILHLTTYESNGKGVGAFEFFGGAGELLSEFILIVLMLLLADGWTIRYKEFPNPEVYYPMLITVGILQLVFAGIGRVTEDTYNKFSDFDGAAGYCLIIMRVIMIFWFIYNYSECAPKLSLQAKNFFNRFAVLSLSYLISFPLLWLICTGKYDMSRHKIFTFGMLLANGLAMIILSSLFSRGSAYYKISTMSSSILPGSKAHNY